MGKEAKELPEAVQQKIADVRQVLENLHRIAVEQETELDALQKKNEELQRTIEEKTTAYNNLSAQAAEEREKLRLSLVAMNEELKKNRENLEENKKNLEEKRAALEKEKSNLVEDRNKLEGQVRDFSEKKGAFEEEKSKWGDLVEQFKDCREQRDGLYQKCQDWQKLYSKEKTRADNLQTKLDEAEAQSKILLDERNTARGDAKYWKQQAGQAQDPPQPEAPAPDPQNEALQQDKIETAKDTDVQSFQDGKNPWENPGC